MDGQPSPAGQAGGVSRTGGMAHVGDQQAARVATVVDQCSIPALSAREHNNMREDTLVDNSNDVPPLSPVVSMLDVPLPTPLMDLEPMSDGTPPLPSGI